MNVERRYGGIFDRCAKPKRDLASSKRRIPTGINGILLPSFRGFLQLPAPTQLHGSLSIALKPGKIAVNRDPDIAVLERPLFSLKKHSDPN